MTKRRRGLLTFMSLQVVVVYYLKYKVLYIAIHKYTAHFHVFAAGVRPRVMADLLLTYRPNLICHSIALSSRPVRNSLSLCMRQGCQGCQAWTRCPRVVAPLLTYTPNLI